MLRRAERRQLLRVLLPASGAADAPHLPGERAHRAVEQAQRPLAGARAGRNLPRGDPRAAAAEDAAARKPAFGRAARLPQRARVGGQRRAGEVVELAGLPVGADPLGEARGEGVPRVRGELGRPLLRAVLEQRPRGRSDRGEVRGADSALRFQKPRGEQQQPGGAWMLLRELLRALIRNDHPSLSGTSARGGASPTRG